MATAPILPFFTDAYLADTIHLTTEEHGAYLLILFYTWRANGMPPADNDQLLARITKMSVRRWKSRLRPVLEPFFTLDDGHWRQKKLEKIWSNVQGKIEKSRYAAFVRHHPEQQREHKQNRKPLSNKQTAHTDASPAHLPTINHEPQTINQPNRNEDLSGSDSKTNTTSTPALDALKPILSDVQYFIRGGKQISPHLKTQLITAKHESEALSSPAETSQLHRHIEQLWRHYRKSTQTLSDGENTALQQDYLQLLSPYPNDLITQVISRTLRTRKYPTLPSFAELEEQLKPQLNLRIKQAERIEKLLAQITK